jgi:hypothetical protein
LTTALIVVGAIVVVVLIGVAVSRRRTDPVESFQRQIDALSPEARRPTIDQVRRADDHPIGDDSGAAGGAGGSPRSSGPAGPGDGDAPDEGNPGSRG